jgi:hypothetical protein
MYMCATGIDFTSVFEIVLLVWNCFVIVMILIVLFHVFQYMHEYMKVFKKCLDCK